ncbi:MAG: ABC transporter ATP-binding protein [Proteobacteria bacterium]|nr:ABC transporter ATP-binding protein [Pseudomonadota bacterium]
MTHKISAKQVTLFIWKIARSFPGGLAVIMITTLAYAIDFSVRPYILKIILNRVSEVPSSSVFDYLWAPAVAYLGMFFIPNVAFRVYEYVVEIHMIPRMRQKIATVGIGMLLDQSQDYYQRHFAGSLTNKINDLTSSIPDIIQKIERFLRYVFAISIATFTLWQANIRFALFMLGWASLFVGVTLLASKRISHLADIWSEWGSTITGRIVDTLSNVLSVRLFARKKAEEASLDGVIEKTVQAEQTLQWAYFWVWLTYGSTAIVMIGLNLYYLIKGRQEGWVTVGDFALVLTINIALVDFLWELTNEISQFSKLFGKITQALRTLLVLSDIKDDPDAKPLLIKKGEIIFDAVHFHYKGAEPLFQKKSVFLLPGQKVGLVGYSGSGKTTFVNLILRLFDVTAGHILIDGQDIRHVTQDSLHSAIGMIPQDPSLFHRTLMDNIRYGHSEATDEDVIEASKKAHAHEFIKVLPEGYSSLVGERGVRLSGGQRQRIAIARAILKNAPILILDEATSQLDSVTENYIQDSLWAVMQEKTTIVIAHRLSTLLHMDRILVFDKGKIVEDGTHQDLLAKGGLYKILWEAQVGGFLPDMRKDRP